MHNHSLKCLIEDVKRQTDIEQVIGQRLTLDRNHKAICPFHQDKEPSFSVNPKGQYFHCFGCGLGGDVIKFIELNEKRSFKEALAELAGSAGIPFPSPDEEDVRQIQESRLIEDILMATAQFYHKNLSPDARTYLMQERGFSNQTISCFLIGYANGGLRRYLIDELKMSLEHCLRAGVLKKTNDNVVKDYFYQRIIFPNIKQGRVVHLTGRSFDGGQPKYLHLPGKIVYFFNEEALKEKEVFVVEGVTDFLSLIQAGFPGVAIYGAANFGQDDVSKFANCEEVYLCLDGDKPGIEGAIRIAGLIGERAMIVKLPDGLDPNSFFKNHSVDDFLALKREAKDLIKYEISLIPQNLDRTELPDRLKPIMSKLARLDSPKAEAYLTSELKPRFRLSKEDVNEYRTMLRQMRKTDQRTLEATGGVSKVKPIYSACFEGLVDLVEQDGKPAFLVKEGDELSVLHQYVKDGALLVPPPRDQIPWLLPRAEAVLNYYQSRDGTSTKDLDAELYDDLLAYHKSISELPSEEHYDLLVAWDFHTYLPEAVQYTPIICLFAIPERGKSRTGKGMIHVAHRGIHVESLREAYLLRVAHDLHASLFFDVRDIWKKAEQNTSDDILLHRFEKGAKVARVIYPDRGAHQDMVYYHVFGPTIIGTNMGVHRILETRAILINMPETSRRFECDVTPENSLPLKERLVAFRARHIGEELPAISKPALGRLGDILKPLLQIILLVRPQKEAAFLELVGELEHSRLLEKADSLEAQLLRCLLALENRMERGYLPVKAITDYFNEGKDEKNRVSYQRVGRLLASMGFKKGRTGAGASTIFWDGDQVQRMRTTFGLCKTSVTSETPERPDCGEGVSELSGVTDVLCTPF